MGQVCTWTLATGVKVLRISVGFSFGFLFDFEEALSPGLFFIRLKSRDDSKRVAREYSICPLTIFTQGEV